jgi:hypothetical protein
MNQPAARDTTFDGITPERVWLTFNNIDRKGYLTVKIEVNGISKIVREFYIAGLHPNEGVECSSHNLTWLLARHTRAIS